MCACEQPLVPILDVFDDDYDPLRDDVYYDDYLHVSSSPTKARAPIFDSVKGVPMLLAKYGVDQ